MKAEEFIDLIPPMGFCATDKITVDGMNVGYMYREEPEDKMDSGWRFFQELKTKNMLTTLTIRCFIM
jgi:hypothetical protein